VTAGSGPIAIDLTIACAVGMASDSEATPRFNAFYEQYARGCRDLGVAPLSPEVLLVLLDTLLQRARAMLR
jgi:hypothetical protein